MSGTNTLVVTKYCGWHKRWSGHRWHNSEIEIGLFVVFFINYAVAISSRTIDKSELVCVN